MALTKQSKIRWKRQDYLTLGRAVAAFNKKINSLNAEEKKLYLPELQNYKEVKENITTRSELNRVINSLRRFSRVGAEELYTTEAGEQITKWERRELGIMSRTAQRRLTLELKELEEPNIQGISRVQMGSIRQREIEAEIRRLKEIEKKVGFDFERLSRKIKILGASDYTLKMSYVYQNNFMEQLSHLAKTSEEFKPIYEKFVSIKNPITFFNETQKSEALQDFFQWYRNPESYASFATQDDLAEYIMNEYK